MARVRRTDLTPLAAPVRRDNGTIVVEGRVARTGVLVYPQPDGTVIREYVPPEELFSAPSMDSLKLVPITCRHPSALLAEGVPAQNVAVGAVGESVRRDGEWLCSSMVVFDERSFDVGNQLSCGYTADTVATPGVSPAGFPYDVIQRGRVYDHLAIEPRARAGEGAQARLDAAGKAACVSDAVAARDAFATRHYGDAAQRRAALDELKTACADAGVEVGAIDMPDSEFACACPDCTQGSSHMPDKSKTDAKNMDAATALASVTAQLAETQAKATEAQAKADAATARADALEGELIEVRKAADANIAHADAVKLAAETSAIVTERKRADAAEAQVAQFDARFDAAVKERTAIMFKAAGVLGRDFRFDGVSNEAIVASVVKHLDAHADMTAAAGVLRGRFDAMVARHEGTARALGGIALQQQAREDAAEDPYDAYRARQNASGLAPLPSTLAHRGAVA